MGYLAIRPGGRVYVRRDGEDRFTSYRVRVFASIRNEFWAERIGTATRTAASGDLAQNRIANAKPGTRPKSSSDDTAGTSTQAEQESPPEPSFFSRLFARFRKSPEGSTPGAGSVPDGESVSEAEEVEARMAWFSDSTRLIFLYRPNELSVMVFRGDVLRGTLGFRPIKARLAVPDHADDAGKAP